MLFSENQSGVTPGVAVVRRIRLRTLRRYDSAELNHRWGQGKPVAFGRDRGRARVGEVNGMTGQFLFLRIFVANPGKQDL
jgi:hypothetical protein